MIIDKISNTIVSKVMPHVNDWLCDQLITATISY